MKRHDILTSLLGYDMKPRVHCVKRQVLANDQQITQVYNQQAAQWQ